MISIITPVYNGKRFIESCIKGVIAQDCLDMEHIIVDGGSTDQTVEIIKQYAKQYSHIRWISEQDNGQSDAMNKGIAMARGNILSFLNIDDFYEPNVLNRVLEIFKTLPEPSLLVGNCNVWNDEGKLMKLNKPRKLKITDLLMGANINPHPINPSAYFYHTSLHQEIGFYDASEHYALDLDFLLRAVQAAKVQYVDEIWGNYRQIQGTKTHIDWASGEGPHRAKKLLNIHRKRLPLPTQLQVLIRYYFYRLRDKLYRLSRTTAK